MLIAACGLALSGCTGTSTTAGLFATANPPPPQHWTLHVKSEPPGAEAKVPQGPSCRTPCELTLPMADTSVTVTLAGYHGQTIPVKWLPATFHYEMYERTEEPQAIEYPTDFSPNPVIARLDPAPAGPAKRKPKPKRQTAAAPAAPPASSLPTAAR
jgi:hypothetical protein